MIFTADSLSIGQTFTKTAEHNGSTFAFTLTITQLGPKQATCDYGCSIDGKAGHVKQVKMSRVMLADLLNGVRVHHSSMGMCEGQWDDAEVLAYERECLAQAAAETEAREAAQSSEATTVTVYNVATGALVMRREYADRAEAMRVAREWQRNSPAMWATLTFGEGPEMTIELAEARLQDAEAPAADEPLLADGGWLGCPGCGCPVLAEVGKYHYTCACGHAFDGRQTYSLLTQVLDLAAEPHTPEGAAYAAAMGATQCDSCDAILMGSEQLGTTCNACLELRGAIAERQRLKARVAELGAEVSQQAAKVAQAEARCFEAGAAYVANMEMTELSALGRAHLAHKRLADELAGLTKLLASAREALEAAKARCKTLDKPAAAYSPEQAALDYLAATKPAEREAGPLERLVETMAKAQSDHQAYITGLQAERAAR